MKIILNPSEKQFDTFIRSVPYIFYKEGETIYKQRNEIKVFDVDGIRINVKRYKVPHVINRIVYGFFRLSKAERSYRYALVLKEKKIETPDPVAYILMKRKGLLYESYYISKQADYDRTMYEFGQGGVLGREHIVQAFVRFTANLHEQGVYHKDYSPGNILFKERNEQVDFCIVDINRMRFGYVSAMLGCANFARLWGQKDLFLFVANAYAHLRNMDADECVKRVLHYRNKFWKRYAQKRPVPFEFDE